MGLHSKGRDGYREWKRDNGNDRGGKGGKGKGLSLPVSKSWRRH